MKCYASICSLEEKYAKLEVTMRDISESFDSGSTKVETQIIDASYAAFPMGDETFFEGDIVVVEYDSFDIHVLYKDEAEKRRRVERIREIKRKLLKKQGGL